jgi:hypothetical protein
MSQKCPQRTVLNHSITWLAIASKVWGTVSQVRSYVSMPSMYRSMSVRPVLTK